MYLSKTGLNIVRCFYNFIDKINSGGLYHMFKTGVVHQIECFNTQYSTSARMLSVTCYFLFNKSLKLINIVYKEPHVD